MPRILEGSARKEIVTARVDPDLLAEVKEASTENISRVVEAALRLWLKREQRRGLSNRRASA